MCNSLQLENFLFQNLNRIKGLSLFQQNANISSPGFCQVDFKVFSKQWKRYELLFYSFGGYFLAFYVSSKNMLMPQGSLTEVQKIQILYIYCRKKTGSLAFELTFTLVFKYYIILSVWFCVIKNYKLLDEIRFIVSFFEGSF